MSAHTSVRQLALVSAVVGAVFATSASAQLFSSGSGSVKSFPNSVKINGELTCTLPDLGVFVDTNVPQLILTDKSVLNTSFNPNTYTDFYPGTVANCTETVNGTPVEGTGIFQQATNKSGTINPVGGSGANSVPSGLVVTTTSANGTTTYTLRFYVDDRSQTDEKARYKITFDDPLNNPLCKGVIGNCVHKMGLPDPSLDFAETEVTKGSVVFPALSTGNPSTSFLQYVMEELSVTVNGSNEVIAMSDFKARWRHNGSEDSNDPILVEYIDSSGSGKPVKYLLRTTVETALDIFVEFSVGPVVTSLTGVTPVYVLSSAEFDATTITATQIEVNGAPVDCRSTSTIDINGDGRIDWRCAAEKSQFVPAATACPQTAATAAFAVQVVFNGKERMARDLASTFPVNCN